METIKNLETTSKRVLAIVVTYNRKDLLKETIDALMSQLVSCDVLIVNNNSTDGTKEYIEENYKGFDQLFLANLPENVGGAGGFNYGVRWGVEKNYDFLWLMDDDCIVHEDSLTALFEADHLLGGPEKYGFLSSAVLWTDGHVCIMNKPKAAKDFYIHLEHVQHGIIAITQATFVSLFLPVSTVVDFGLPIKEYFIWGDDIEFTQRIALRGKKASFLVGKSIVTHKMKTNVGSDISQDNIERIDRYRLAFRNECYTYRRCGFKGIIVYLGRCAKAFKDIVLHAKSHRCKRFGALFKGFFQGVVFYPKVEHICLNSSDANKVTE